MMMSKRQILKLTILGIFCFMSFKGFSQTGILTDTPDKSSALEIFSTEKGLLIPRLTAEEKSKIKKPANGLIVFDTDANSISQNIGTKEVPIWENLTLFNKQSFYMPSINIPTINVGDNVTIDLFKEYKDQFAAPMFISSGAPAAIPQYESATDLFYYITYFDPELIEVNAISSEGVLNYTVLKKANYDAYVNIVFVVK